MSTRFGSRGGGQSIWLGELTHEPLGCASGLRVRSLYFGFCLGGERTAESSEPADSLGGCFSPRRWSLDLAPVRVLNFLCEVCLVLGLEVASQGTLVIKNPPASEGDARDAHSIPGSGRSLGGEPGNPLQYYYLENPMDRGTWWATVHGIAKRHD